MATMHIGRSAPARRRAVLPLTAVAVLLLAVAACGSGSKDNKASGGAGGLTSIGVAYSQPIDYQVAKIAVDQGYFKQNGLDVTLKSATTGAQILALVASNQIQFGQMNQQIILNAYNKGTDLKIC